MTNPILRPYEASPLVIKTKATNLFWILTIFSLALIILTIILLYRPVLAVITASLAVGLLVIVAVLWTGRYTIASFLTTLILVAAATAVSLVNRDGPLETDYFQVISLFSLALSITTAIATNGLAGGFVTLSGIAALIVVINTPVKSEFFYITVEQLNNGLNPGSHLALMGIAGIMGTFNLYQYRWMLNSMQASAEIIEEQNKNLSQRVLEKTSSIRNLMDNTGQGFLSFGSDFMVHGEYSRGCVDIFGKAPVDQRVDQLLFPQGGEAADDFVQGLGLYFAGSAKAEVIFDLLEKSLYLSGKYITVDYREAGTGSVLCVLTDVTVDKRLEERNREEAERQGIILRAINNKLFFAGFIAEAAEMFELLQAYERVKPSQSEIESFLRHLHTFKGNAGFFNFRMTQEVAHDFEYAISDSLILGEEIPFKDFSLDLKRGYYHELKFITDTMGKGWIEEAGGIVVPRSDYSKVSAYIRKKFPQEIKIIRFLEHYRKVLIRDLFSRFAYIAAAAAERLGKTIKPLVVKGGDFRVLPDKFELLAEVSVHLVNNMVDHGIEYAYEREAIQKDPAGNLEISIDQGADSVVILFRDDGRGISSAELERRCREKGFIQDHEKPSPQEILTYIFHDGFTTRDEATEISGRGLGLAAVKEEVERLGGTIAVYSKIGLGTEFQIIVPTSGKKQSKQVTKE